MSLFGAAAEAVEGAEGRVLLVGHARRGALELLSCQRDHSRVVALPQQAGGLLVALLQVLDEGRDRSGSGHEGLPANKSARSGRKGPALVAGGEDPSVTNHSRRHHRSGKDVVRTVPGRAST